MGGLQVLEHLKATRQNGFLTTLLIDAHDYDVPLVATAFRLGVQSFLTRPIGKKEFCTVMSLFDTVTMDCCAQVHPNCNFPSRNLLTVLHSR
jgi:PleD family two-component response regulator